MAHDLNDLRLFVQVAAAGGYAQASRAYGVPRATLSRRVAALEAALGLRLIERSSRSFRLTSAGEQLFERARRVVAEAEEAFDALAPQAGAPQGLIRFAVAPSVLQLQLDAMIAAYLAAFPSVTVEIEATNRRVDLLRDGFDFVIRAGETRSGPQEQVVLPFAPIEHVLVIAPELRSLLGPTLGETLKAMPVLAWAASGQAANWRLVGPSGKFERIALAPRLAVEDMAALRQAALAGIGMALMPRLLVEEDLAEGRLHAVELDLCPPMGRIHAVHLGKKGMRPVVRHLLDWLVEAFGELRERCEADRTVLRSRAATRQQNGPEA